jgi:hypothetical protein
LSQKHFYIQLLNEGQLATSHIKQQTSYQYLPIIMADTKHIHKTLPITPEEFQPGGVRLYSHTQEEISNVIIKHVSRTGEDLLPRQIEGLANTTGRGTWASQTIYVT